MYTVKYIIFFLFFICFTITKARNLKNLTVEINTGLVRGREGKTVGLNLTYYAFQGIPYAEPPIGSLRFEPPVPKKRWNGVLDATKDGAICVQSKPPEGSEDCLFINVYVPKTSKFNTKLLPTMVWIFGGGFEAGFANYDLYGPDYLLEKDVIVVSFNYRLGIFGFMTTGDLIAPGNNGLKDQVLALKWVRDNIKSFGGDPNRVTLFGQSAGSASVSYHMQSPQSQGLFHQAILESGVSLSPWAFSRHAVEAVKQIGKDLKLDVGDNSLDLVKALKKVEYKTLQTAAASAVAFKYLASDPRTGFIFAPVIEPEHDGAFFTKKSHELLSKGEFNKVPCIVGFNSLEGTFNFGTLFKLFLLKYDVKHSQLIPFDLNVEEDKKDTVATLIKKYYFGSSIIAFSDIKLMRFLSDDLFARPVREYVRLVSKYVPVYYYKFGYEGGLWGYQNRSHPGVAHSEELGYIWRSKYTPSSNDLFIRKKLTTMWTDFAKTGNPTPQKYFTTEKVIWKKTDLNFTYLDIGSTLVLRQFPEKNNMIFWDEIYQVYGNPPYDTY